MSGWIGTERPLAIMAALEEEAVGLFAELARDPEASIVRIGGRDIHVGRLWGRPVVLTLAGIGKVAAATTAAALIHSFDVEGILVTGVAGAAAAHVRIGDVVVADMLLQHDFDASPLFPRFEIPRTGLARFPADRAFARNLSEAARDYLADHPAASRTGTEQEPALHRGLIVSGDRFVNGTAAVAALRRDLPDALAIEMEGAAVAQVCHDYRIPVAVIRTISDSADDSAHVDFAAFLRDVASHYSYEIVRRLLQHAPASG
jgi:adenosylhomocysteine nucleosidase